jgi:lipoprotein-releasing system permease protein
LNLPFFIAKRYFISKKSHNAINIISGVSVVGIAIGTMALVVILSVFNGLSDLVKSMYNSTNPDISIAIIKGKVFSPNSEEFNSIKNIKDIAYYNETVEGKALIKYQDKQAIVNIKGVGNQYAQMSDFGKILKEGGYNINNNYILISKGTQYTLNYILGDMFTPLSIFSPKRGKVNTLDDEAGLNELKCYASGVFSINDHFDGYTIMSLENARMLLDYTHEVSSIELYLKKDSDLNAVQNKIEKILGDKYEVKNKEQQNAVLYKTMKSEKLWTFIILAFILTVATFNMIASLTMLIIEKKKDVFIMRYLGANSKLIRKIFLFEGMLITSIGAITGLALGLLLCWLQIHFSLITLSDGFVISAYPIKTELTDIVIVMLTVMTIGLISTWYPVKILVKKLIA